MPELIYNIGAPVVTGVASVVAISPPVVGFATSLGTFFAPNTAAAAGGALNIIGASNAGALLTFIPGMLGIGVASLLLNRGFQYQNRQLINLAILMGLIAIAVTYLMAAKIGASITGVAASSVLFCNMIGGAVILLGLVSTVALIGVGAVAMSSSFAQCRTSPAPTP